MSRALLLVAFGFTAALAAPSGRAKEPAVTLSASRTKVYELDSVTFTARVRPDLMRTMRAVGHPGDPLLTVPHVIGWRWIPDLDVLDPWTKACETHDLVCSASLHGSGTMVFAIRTVDQVCADWVHVDVLALPDVDETDPTARLRADSVRRAIKTTVPTWKRCTA